MKVLVSGVAGDIGFCIGRILKEWNFFENLHGVDISEDHPGSLIFDQVGVAPRANADNYLEWLTDYILTNQIDLLVPTSEAEIFAISNNLSAIKSLCKVLINDEVLIKNSLDKNKTLKYLNAAGIKVPTHGIVGVGDKPMQYPVIVKPRRGQGSKGFRKISADSELLELTEEYVWQEYLTPDDEEYTCAVYVSKALKSRILLLKRVFNILKGNVKNKKICFLGVTFKANTDDMRDSASLSMIPSLVKKGAIVNYFDPTGEKYDFKKLNNVNFSKNINSAIKDANLIIIHTEWNDFKSINFKKEVKSKNFIIFDLRNIYSHNKMKELKIKYFGVGH